MSQGTWNANSLPRRPGMYNNFVTAATDTVTGGSRGIAAMPIKADWGPVGQVVSITSEGELLRTFGTGGTAGLVRRCLTAAKKFKPKSVLVYRMATASAAAATHTIESVGVFTARYPGARGNELGIEIKENILDEESRDVRVYEGSTLQQSYTVGKADLAGLEAALAADSEALVQFKANGEGELAAASLTKLTGGDSGSEKLTTAEYEKALQGLEPFYYNVLALDGATDADVQSLAQNYVARVRESGKKIQLVMGGKAEEDADPMTGNTRSKKFNAAGIINVIVGTTFNGVSYSSAETACQIAGAIAACPLNDSLTYKELADVDDITVALTNEQISDAIASGSLVLVRDVDDETLVPTVRIEYGINTLTTYSEDEGEKSSKIKTISTIDAIDYDLGNIAARRIIGNFNNDDDGRAAAITLLKAYLETLVAMGAVSSDILMETSTVFKSEGDKWFVDTTALTVDKIERIFNTINY